MASYALPPTCYAVSPITHELVQIFRGESTLYAARKDNAAKVLNDQLGVSHRTAAAMLGGALHGWDTDAASPAKYGPHGEWLGENGEWLGKNGR